MFVAVAVANTNNVNISLPLTMLIAKHNPQNIPKTKLTGFLIILPTFRASA